jgi:chromosome segregation ATPase
VREATGLPQKEENLGEDISDLEKKVEELERLINPAIKLLDESKKTLSDYRSLRSRLASQIEKFDKFELPVEEQHEKDKTSHYSQKPTPELTNALGYPKAIAEYFESFPNAELEVSALSRELEKYGFVDPIPGNVSKACNYLAKEKGLLTYNRDGRRRYRLRNVAKSD